MLGSWKVQTDRMKGGALRGAGQSVFRGKQGNQEEAGGWGSENSGQGARVGVSEVRGEGAAW